MYITGRRKEELDAAAKSLGSNVTAVQSDASKLEDLDRLFVVGRLGAAYSRLSAPVLSNERCELEAESSAYWCFASASDVYHGIMI